MIFDVLKEMKELLTLHLDSELERQDAHANDSLSSPKVHKNSILIGGESLGTGGLPAIVIQPEAFEPDQVITGSKDAIYTIRINCVATHTSAGDAQKLLWRLMRAVENVFEIYATGSGVIFDYTTESMDFTASVLDIAEDRKTEKGGALVATLKERLQAYVQGQI